MTEPAAGRLLLADFIAATLQNREPQLTSFSPFKASPRATTTWSCMAQTWLTFFASEVCVTSHSGRSPSSR